MSSPGEERRAIVVVGLAEALYSALDAREMLGAIRILADQAGMRDKDRAALVELLARVRSAGGYYGAGQDVWTAYLELPAGGEKRRAAIADAQVRP